MTRSALGIYDFVVENWEIKSQTQSDWVGGLHFRFRDVESFLVSFLRIFDNG